MALTRNIENIVKDTGLSEDELASLIINKENEGLTNDEIVDLLVSISDNKEYASKDQDELQALQSLGLKPAVEKQAPGLFDRFAAAGESVANSVTDWRDSHPEQWRVGMVNSIFGDNNMLSQHYAAKQAAEESEKNRESQRDYNEYLKEYDRANAEAEQRAAYKQELKEAEATMAGLNRDLVKANPTDAAVILKQREALLAKHPELASDNTDTDTDTDIAKKAYEDERAYASALNRFKGQVKRVFLTDDEIQNEINRVQAASWISPDDMSKIVDNLQSMKSTAQLARESSQSAFASHAGKKTGESLDDKDITKKANDAIENNTSPANLKQEVRDKIREMNYTWTANSWSKR